MKLPLYLFGVLALLILGLVWVGTLGNSVAAMERVICRSGVEQSSDEMQRVPGAGRLGAVASCYVNSLDGERILVLFVE